MYVSILQLKMCWPLEKAKSGGDKGSFSKWQLWDFLNVSKHTLFSLFCIFIQELASGRPNAETASQVVTRPSSDDQQMFRARTPRNDRITYLLNYLNNTIIYFILQYSVLSDESTMYVWPFSLVLLKSKD